MKVFVHWNPDSNNALLLNLRQTVGIKDVKDILQNNTQNDAISRLIMRSSSMVEVSPENVNRAKCWADFTISDHYTAERLA